ncbi:MAG: GAF domain-containing sensor histidine kinase [Oscillatoriaceae bacterium SKW80]|nr:GAF domain-containing sensor histidine kinase [Oscillatoriaceae bacterium SKYG93]MCX8121403.1 GAF domain-containing sensor histidine kinase [Oscillatoriaceae bacterium SKW80]MDW8451920.1 GAF domain-containing sensor histidine kinase [Oscillatoriaceae cyanobacterium SKYGB_i_bin93]
MALCQAQVALLTQALKASLCVVYLTEEIVEQAEAKLVPILAYPETAVMWETNPTVDLLPNRQDGTLALPGLELGETGTLQRQEREKPSKNKTYPKRRWQGRGNEQEKSLVRQQQLVMPLMHEGVVVGLLVTGREDKPWNEREVSQIERIAHTIAIARILDQRAQWLNTTLHKQKQFYQQQRDILDNLLHQLRNPLTALRTFGKLLLRRLLPSDNNREIASSIVRESDRLQELLQQMDQAIDAEIEDLATTQSCLSLHSPASVANEWDDYAGESQTLPLLPAFTVEACSVAEVLEPLLLSSKMIAAERLLKCIAEIPQDLPPVLANPKALREVLSNLIDNALKYTPAGGEIYIKAGDRRQIAEREQLAIAVSDTGPGIPQQDLQHLFQRHYRGVQANTNIPGSGLGLAIARELLTQMQAEIQVFSPRQQRWLPAGALQPTSEAPGTSFVVWLLVE